MRPCRHSPPGLELKPPAQGFTLIEILVVLVVVSVLSGFAVLSLRGRDVQSVVDEEADRLLMLVTLAQEEALFRYRTIGIRFTSQGYRFFEYRNDAEAWEPTLDPLLRDRTLGEGMGFRLYIEGRPVVLDVEAEEEILPQIVLFPDGTGTAFEIAVVVPPDITSSALKGTVSGRIDLENSSASG